MSNINCPITRNHLCLPGLTLSFCFHRTRRAFEQKRDEDAARLVLQEQAGKESDAKHEEEEEDGDIKNFDLVKDKDKTLYKELGLAAAALAPLLRVIVNVPPLR